MPDIIKIDGKDVPFRATAAVPRLYRIKFRRDIIQDMQAIQRCLDQKKENEEVSLPPEALEMFENIAYIMAKHADKNVPESPDEWLEQFDMFSIYYVLPHIIELWGLTNRTTSTPKKK